MQTDWSTNYYAFLLRLWREEEQMPWRASLEDPHTGEKVHFAELEKLVAFLRQIDQPPPASASHNETGISQQKDSL